MLADISRRSSIGLAHNSYFQAHNWAEYEYYQENQIKKLRFVAELDRRTTPFCVSLDQRVFPIEEVPLPPLHWMCRSHVQPVIDGGEIGGKRIARKDTEPRTVKHRDGTTSTKYEKLNVDHVSSRMTHSQWVQSLVNSKSRY
jgi:SPP1 gp7 family putative phage head morphogenesis protein